MAQCQALIVNAKGQALAKRASDSLDPRCQRHARKGHLHCYQHLPAEWKTHYAILERIRSLPERDIK